MENLVNKKFKQFIPNDTGIPVMFNGQKFIIDYKLLGEFFSSFCELTYQDELKETMIFDDEDDEFPLPSNPYEFNFSLLGHSLSEIITDKLPVMIHLILKDEYDKFLIVRLGSMIQNILMQKLNVSKNNLILFVEESRGYKIGRDIYFNVNFIFPYCHVNVDYLKEVITKEVKHSLMSFLPFDWEIIQIENYVPMYRGKFDPKHAPCRLTSIYGVIDNVYNPKEYKLSRNIFIPENYQFIYKKLISSSFLETNGDLYYWYPLLRSIHFWSGETTVREVVPNSPTASFDEDVTHDNPKTMLKYLLPLISKTRINQIHFWKEIGQCIYNIHNGSDEGFRLFRLISSKFADNCRDYYYSLNPNHLTIKTIGWYARRDSPREYETWHKNWYKKSLLDALTLIHDDVADAVYRVLWLDHIWAGGKRWYRFDNNRLVEQSEAVDLRRDMKEKVVRCYKELRKRFQDMSSNTDSPSEERQSEQYIKEITKLIEKMGNHNWKSTIVKACQQYFEVKDFDKYRDADPTKTGWSNCVIVCTEDKAFPTEGKLEDFITKSTKIPFRTDYSWESKHVVEVMKWIRQIFHDEELIHYMLKDFSSFLYGKNSEKILRCWCGDGNNSKTMLSKLVQLTLGDYAVDLPPSILTGKSSANGPSPELAQTKGAKVGFVPETENEEKIKEGTVKRLTGNDKLFARFCYDNGSSFDISIKVVILCNRIPEFTTVSKALINRFVYVPFLSTWTDDAPDDEEEQFEQRRFKLDPFFDSRLDELAQAFGWILVNYYSFYKKEGLTKPRAIVEYTEKHWEENDPIRRFVKEKITKGDKSFSCTYLYNVFKTWYCQNFPNYPMISRPNFKNALEDHIGKPCSNGRWKGFEIIERDL
ncbi:MAG: hypothetical protein KatS3mg101_0822 [Patescibacteria group bacterium]|nr:MAG: hypothetical protein KatS3mg101_0822 [Patescibacteria group bacterium]